MKKGKKYTELSKLVDNSVAYDPSEADIAKRILKEVEKECGWMYETLHTDGKTKGKINYTVWSDVFVCPECTKEVVFWDAAVDQSAGKVYDEFPCPHCSTSLTKRKMERAWVSFFDEAISEVVKQAKKSPVLINYSVGKLRTEKTPDANDLRLIEKIETAPFSHWFPCDRMMAGKETRRNDPIGLTHIHHFYTKRNLLILSALSCNSRILFVIQNSRPSVRSGDKIGMVSFALPYLKTMPM